MHLDTLTKLLGGFAFRYSTEVQLHDRIARVLSDAGWQFERERRIDDKNRLDFLLEAGIAIEVKVDGALSEAVRQVARYLALEEVRAVLLASTKPWADTELKAEICKLGWEGKPFGMVRLRRQAL